MAIDEQIAETPPEANEVETELGEREPGTAVLYDQSWTASWLRPLLITIMVLCINIALLAFLQRFVPSASGAYAQAVILMGMVAAIVGCISTTWLAQPAQRLHRSTGYRVAELGLLLVIARILIWIAAGTWPSVSDLMTRPLDALVEGFIFAIIVIVLSWIMASEMTRDLINLALRPDDLYATRSFANRWQDNTRPIHSDRAAILRRFVTRWLVGGIFLVMLAASSQVGPAQNGLFAITRQSIDPIVIAAIIVYFLLGLILISQGQLALLRARWTLQKTPNSRAVLRNWSFYAGGLILAIGLIALLMPFGGTFRLAQILSYALQVAYYTLVGLFRAILLFLLYLISFFTGDEPPQAPPEAAPAQQFIPPPAPEATSEFPTWIGGALFWAIAALLLGYAAYIYFSGKGFDAAWFRRIWQMIRERWALFFGAYQDWRATHLHIEKEQEDDGSTKSRFGGLTSWLRLRNLDPDQQVRYYYFSTLHRAEQIGTPRDQSETPSSYAPRLVAKYAQTSDDETAISELTDAFVRVRYAGSRTDVEQVSGLKTAWKRIRGFLKKPVVPSSEQGKTGEK